VNNRPEVVLNLTRDGVCERFVNEPSILSPVTIRVDRQRLETIARRADDLQSVAPGMAFPVIVRPISTHAGQGMEKIESVADLEDYLQRRDEGVFYVAPFIDYSGADGLFRKQRIAFIDGRAYPGHWATSDHWMVHYLSAEMAEHPVRRAEEEAWMRDFDSVFAVRYAAAFEALHRQFGLDYFGIDCAEMPDGRLLLFEADVAMIVHDLDSSSTFPYKKPAMRRLFDAFTAMIKARSAGSGRASNAAA
jgi:glutathione synthase/RimK-type ligase-like ATP-grasp enzyme